MSQPLSQRFASATPRLADQVIRAGAIYSMAEDRKVYRSIAIRDEWIVAVSEDSHGLDGLITAGTLVVDDPGLTVIPAFDDTHNHLILAAQNMGLVPVDRAPVAFRRRRRPVRLRRCPWSRSETGESRSAAAEY